MIKGQLTDVLSPEFVLFDTYPITLPLFFDIKIDKRIPVKFNLDITFDRQYNLMGDITLKPDSVTISGPKELIDTTTYWNTEAIKFENVNESKTGKVDLIEAEILNISFSETEIEYNIPIELFTEASTDVDIQAINVPDGIEAVIYPKKLTVTYLVGTGNYDKVTTGQFIAVADFAGVDLEKEQYVNVKITQHPDYVQNIKANPKSVEFIIYK